MNSSDFCNTKAIVFDLGNVLVDIDFRQFTKNTGLDNSLSEKDVFERLKRAAIQYEKGEIDTNNFYKVFSKEFLIKIDFELFRSAWCSVATQYVRGMDELVSKLRLKHPLYLLSNTNELHFIHIKDNFPILNVFKKYFLSFEIGFIKPEKEIYLYMLDKLDYNPEEIIYIDDKIVNIESAKLIGIDCLHFTNAVDLENKLREKNIGV